MTPEQIRAAIRALPREPLADRCAAQAAIVAEVPALLDEIDRLRALLDAAGAVVSDIGCECTCHERDRDEGEHDDDCDGPCAMCRVADALWPEQRRGAG